MPETSTEPLKRPKALTPKPQRRYVKLSPIIDAQVRALATQERRTITAQIELLIERGLRSYGLEMTA